MMDETEVKECDCLANEMCGLIREITMSVNGDAEPAFLDDAVRAAIIRVRRDAIMRVRREERKRTKQAAELLREAMESTARHESAFVNEVQTFLNSLSKEEEK